MLLCGRKYKILERYRFRSIHNIHTKTGKAVPFKVSSLLKSQIDVDIYQGFSKNHCHCSHKQIRKFLCSWSQIAIVQDCIQEPLININHDRKQKLLTQKERKNIFFLMYNIVYYLKKLNLVWHIFYSLLLTIGITIFQMNSLK